MIRAYMGHQLEEKLSRPSRGNYAGGCPSTASIKKREAPQVLRNQTKIGTWKVEKL